MTLTEMEQSIADAKAELARADITTASLAKLLCGRLRTISNYHDRRALCQLKRELRAFHGQLRTWEEER